MHKKLFPLLSLCSLLSGAPYRPTDWLLVGGGCFNIVHNRKSPLVQLEYRPDYVLYHGGPLWIYPLVGGMATLRGSAFFFGGIAFELALGEHIVFTPSFAIGIYEKGKGMELGFPQENRSSVELAYRTDSGMRIGAQFYHLSNASLGFRNPGTECLLLFVGLPL